jgi:protein-disulfide isomerase
MTKYGNHPEDSGLNRSVPWIMGILIGMLLATGFIAIGVVIAPRVNQYIAGAAPASSGAAAAALPEQAPAAASNSTNPGQAAQPAAPAAGPAQVSDLIFPTITSRLNEQGNTMGAADAPVLVEAISNFQCSHCTTFTVGDILGTAGNKVTETYIYNTYIATGKVKLRHIVYSWTPDQQFAPEEGAYCAGDQNKFFEYRDLVFLNKDNVKIGGLTKDNLVLFAQALNLDMTAFNDCFDTHKYFYKISEDMTYARNAGLTGTPSFIVNGQLIAGSGQLISLIESNLSK